MLGVMIETEKMMKKPGADVIRRLRRLEADHSFRRCDVKKTKKKLGAGVDRRFRQLMKKSGAAEVNRRCDAEKAMIKPEVDVDLRCEAEKTERKPGCEKEMIKLTADGEPGVYVDLRCEAEKMRKPGFVAEKALIKPGADVDLPCHAEKALIKSGADVAEKMRKPGADVDLPCHAEKALIKSGADVDLPCHAEKALIKSGADVAETMRKPGADVDLSDVDLRCEAEKMSVDLPGADVDLSDVDLRCEAEAEKMSVDLLGADVDLRCEAEKMRKPGCDAEKALIKPRADVGLCSLDLSELRLCDAKIKKKMKMKKGGKDVNQGSLPCDMVVEILSRLPVKSMMKFETVCKKWCSVIQNPTFLKLGFDRSNAEDHICLFLEDFRSNISYIYSFKLNEEGGANVPTPTTTFVEKHDLPPVGNSKKAYCNGLLCYYTWSCLGDDDFFHLSRRFKLNLSFRVCNLTTKQRVKVPPPPSTDFIHFGFGFNPSTNNYTIVLHSERQCHLFTVGAGTTSYTWRKVSSIPPQPYITLYDDSLCVNGVLHWNSPSLNLITWFDLRTEEFGDLPYPTSLSNYSRLYEFQGSPCLIYQNILLHFLNLWVLKDYNNHSWDCLRFDLTLPVSFLAPKYFRNWDVTVVVSSQKKGRNGDSDYPGHYLLSYNLHTSATKKVKLLGLPSNANIVSLGEIGDYKENKNLR